MSGYENGAREGESRSSVKITMAPNGDAKPEVKVYEGTTQEDLDATREMAVRAYLETVKAVRS